METQGEYLEEALGGEDADEAHVEVLEGEHPHLGLAVVVQRHGEHVQPDEDHDDHVELLVGHNPEHDGLWSPLNKKELDNTKGVKEISQYFSQHSTFANVHTLGLGIAFTGFFLPIFFMAA